MKTRVEKIDDEGFGVGKINNKDVHIPFTTIEDLVEIKKWYRKRKVLVACDYEIIEESKKREIPKCKYFGKCGGCILQHLSYKEQIKLKKEKLERLFGLSVKILPSPKIYGYRNRIDIAITDKGIGFREREKWWKIVDIEECKLFGKKSKLALEKIREFMRDFKLEPFNLRKSEGFLRYIVLREGKFTNELMVNLVTYKGKMPKEIKNYFDFASSLYWSINETKSDISCGEPKKFWGKEFIEEKLNSNRYLIHPNTFFQTNSYQAAKLIKIVEKFVDGNRVLDLYCGVGTFSIYLAKKGLKVDSIDIDPFAIKIAKRNAKINNVKVKFYIGEDKNVVNLEYDTIIVDPPRSGLHPKLIKKLLKEKPKNIIYVSCNPKSLKNDIEKLNEIYRAEEMVALDMFPQTMHIETILNLKLKI
jgi:23S rRNA (uracil-5-)-methyltransferase RumA